MGLVCSDEDDLIRTMTLQGLDETPERLEMLKSACCSASALLLSGAVDGLETVPSTAQAIHEFVAFEREIVSLFKIDVAAVRLDNDSLGHAESDMHEILTFLNVSACSMDRAAAARALSGPMQAILNRFQRLLPVLREAVCVSSVV